jgi:hypothetical protein
MAPKFSGKDDEIVGRMMHPTMSTTLSCSIPDPGCKPVFVHTIIFQRSHFLSSPPNTKMHAMDSFRLSLWEDREVEIVIKNSIIVPVLVGSVRILANKLSKVHERSFQSFATWPYFTT